MLPKKPTSDNTQEFIQDITYEAIVAEMKTALINKWRNDLNVPVTDLSDSDPASKIIEIVAYRELYIRQRVKESLKNSNIATARDHYLDTLANLFSYTRNNGETDEALRQRIINSQKSSSPSGATKSYREAALTHAEVKDAQVYLESKGSTVIVSILFNDMNENKLKEEWLDKIKYAIDKKRIITDYVKVEEATNKNYQINATLTLLAGPGGQQVIEEIGKAVKDYVGQNHRLGHLISRAGLYHCLYRPGIKSVKLEQPEKDIETTQKEAPYCKDIILTINSPTGALIKKLLLKV